MNDSTVLQVTKPIKWYNKKVKTNFKKLFTALTKSAIMAWKGDQFNAVKEGIGIVDAFEFKDDPNGLAYLLILKSMINSANNLAKENQHKFRVETKDLEVLYDDDDYVKFLDGMDAILEKQELTINKNSLTNPRSLKQIIEPFQAYFKEWIQFFGINAIEAEVLSNRLPTYFVFAFNGEWRQEAAAYKILTRNLETPATKAAIEELEWMQYNSFLQQQVELPIFDEHFSLRQIYIPLRAYYTKEIEQEGLEKKENVKIPIHLEEELAEWLKTTNRKETIKIISGGPGSGKSTLAKIWSARQAEKGAIRTVFIPLHFFDLQGDLVNSLGKFIELNTDIHLSYNPLKRDEKVLLVFDGLDELTQQGEYAAEVARRFVQAIHQQNAYCNRDNNIKVLFLLLGRELVVQTTSSSFQQEKQVLHLLPYYILRKEHDGFAKEEPLLELDQRDAWWQNYGQLTNQDFKAMPEELKNSNLDEITAQPLLNYLVALSRQRGKIKFSAETNLNEIYNDLIEGVHERQYEGGREYKAIEGLQKGDFKRVLEEIAIAAWHGGDLRTTTVRRIQKHIERSGLQTLLDRFKEGAKTGITRLLTAFYFREYGIEYGEQTFEFTHKSFGEYLTATRLVKLVKKTHHQLELRQSDYDLGWNEKKSLQTWIEVAGESAIDTYLFPFIKNEFQNYSVEELQSWQDNLSKLINFVLINGWPTYKHEATIEENWSNSRNAEEALLVVLNCCALKTKKTSQINFPSEKGLGRWLSKFHPQRSDSQNPVAYECLSYLKLNKQFLFSHDLYNTNFANNIWHNFHLNAAFLFGVNLYNSSLIECRLYSAVLTRADLRYANLHEILLAEANLAEANLIEANLTAANLTAANLAAANLTGANLTGANLTGANLTGANLTEANLTKANLTKANFKNVKGLSARLLINTISLKHCKGLNRKIRRVLNEKKPQLFQ